ANHQTAWRDSIKNSRTKGEIAGSFSLEDGLALLQKCPRPLPHIAGSGEEPEVVGLEQKGLVQTHLQAGVHRLETSADRERTVFQNGSQELLGLLQEPIRGDHPVDQSDTPGFLGINHLTG